MTGSRYSLGEIPGFQSSVVKSLQSSRDGDANASGAGAIAKMMSVSRVEH